LPKRGATSKRRRNRSASARRQWAAAVVQKAAPKIEGSLIEAAGVLDEHAPKFPAKPPTCGLEEDEDESLAALLLRLLRTPETRANSDAGANAMTFASQNPSVG